jgi:translocator protein
MKKRQTLLVLNALTLLIAVVINYLANSIPLNGQTTGDISNKFDVLFKPAGYVFSIWGFIYLGLLVFIVFQFLPSQRKSNIVEKIGIYFITTNIANALWIFNWHNENFLFTLLLMFTILYSLIQIYIRLQVSLEIVEVGKKIFIHFPISLYTSWIMVATITNIFVYLESIQWNGWGLPNFFWFGAAILLCWIVLLVFMIYRTDMIMGTVFLWVFWGIAVQNDSIAIASVLSWIGAGGVLLIFLFGIYKKIAFTISTYQSGT